MRLVLILVLMASPALADRLEGRRSLSDTPWGYGIVTAPTRAGAEAQRFEVRPGDCAAQPGWDDCARDRERSEFRPDLEWAPGRDTWIGFSVYLPPDFEDSRNVNTSLFQIHRSGGPQRVAGGRTSNPPLMQIEARGGTLGVTIFVTDGPNPHAALATLAQMRGRWTDIAVHFDDRDPPMLEVYVNGEVGAIFTDWPLPDPDFYYLKYGLYRSFVSRHGGPMPTQVAIFDEMRVGIEPGAVIPDPGNPVD
ncbi:MAG: heparin lyase I family protein [Rhodobacter sp.]|nr:polysaccharide lyase [Paracoccaceae bacterium]MCC0076771.1 heparin lyase I family protein [Rhodobacter sp.]